MALAPTNEKGAEKTPGKTVRWRVVPHHAAIISATRSKIKCKLPRCTIWKEWICN